MKYRLFAAFIACLTVLSLISCGGAYQNNNGNDPSQQIFRKIRQAQIYKHRPLKAWNAN